MKLTWRCERKNSLDWDPGTWKKSRKLALGVATVWPPIYTAGFVMIVFGITAYFTVQGLEPPHSYEPITT
jgi:hypothetical protein